MPTPTLRSPNEMLAAAREHMLGGREPQTREDWARVMNFLAFNVHPECAREVCKFLRSLYDMPLSDQEIEEIVAFQLSEVPL